MVLSEWVVVGVRGAQAIGGFGTGVGVWCDGDLGGVLSRNEGMGEATYSFPELVPSLTKACSDTATTRANRTWQSP